jgi:hypothetical protein
MAQAVERKTLVLRSRNGGFFSNFNCVMSNLERYLGKDGFAAAEVVWPVRADLPHFSYGRAEDGNVWLHFFEPLDFPEFPPTRVEMSEYPKTGVCLISSLEAYATYKLNWRWRRIYHRLFTRFIKLRPFLIQRVDGIVRDDMAGRFCVGVHYRNPQHAGECPRPIPEPEAFIARVRRLLPAGRPVAVVLASDVEPAVEAFRAAFGDTLVVQPEVTRALSLAQEQLHHGAAHPSLNLGEQVLMDCLLLARCDVLLHVVSNVATAAGFINPRLKLVYCETRTEALQGYLWALSYMFNWWRRHFRRSWDRRIEVFRRLLRQRGLSA